MDDRATIEAILDKAYGARERSDVEEAAACFAENARFIANVHPEGDGAPQVASEKASRLGALSHIFAAYELLEMRTLCRVIDPPRAVVHWHGKFRMLNGNIAETDTLDLVVIRDSKITSLTTFFDTAYAARQSAAKA